MSFEGDFRDQAGSLFVEPGAAPAGSIVPAPAFSTSVPTGALTTAAYGLSANATNQHSLALGLGTAATGASPAYPGASLRIANTSNVFNVERFTVELWINIGAGTPDLANILSKGLDAAPGDYDWQLQYRTGNRLQIQFTRAGGATSAWMLTAASPSLSSGWHHLAFTLDGTSVRVFLDYVPLQWGSSGTSDGSSAPALAGTVATLPWPPQRNTGDSLVLGFFARGINALLDELRFTADVLDPYQMLTAGGP